MTEILQIQEIQQRYPDEWVLLAIDETEMLVLKTPQKGKVLLHGKDYLELCYKGSEIAQNTLTTIFFTGTTKPQHRKWLKATRLQETPKTT